MGLTLITPPADVVVGVAEMKEHLRVDIPTEDTLIETLISVATEHSEIFTRRAFLTQTWMLTLDEFPEEDYIKLPLPPLQTVDSVTYYDDTGAPTVLAAANYVVDATSEPGRMKLVTGEVWPTDTLRELAGVEIEFTCGWTIADEVPRSIYQAVLILVNHFYDQRDMIVQTGAMPKKLPRSFESLLWPWRVIEFS